jgi:MFS family permease
VGDAPRLLHDLVDWTAVSVANPSIMAALHTDYEAVIWVTSAYLLGFAVPLMVAGRLGDRFGPKNLTFGSSVGDGRAMAGPGSFPTMTPCCSSNPENCSCWWNRVAPAATSYLSVSPLHRMDDATYG